MRKIIVFLYFCVIVLFPYAAFSQSNNAAAEKIVNAAVSKMKRAAYETDFSLVYYDAVSENNNLTTGHLIIDGRRFNVSMDGIQTFYDGLTQWVYLSDVNEVTITEPSGDELRESNPMVMMEYYVKHHRINFGDYTEPLVDVINFFPHNPKGSDFFKITLILDSGTGFPKSITIYQRNGDKISLYWDSFRTIIPKTDTFRFNSANYNDLIINDLR